MRLIATDLLGTYLVFFSVHCGVGLEDSGGPNVDNLIKNEKLRDEYEAFKGV